LFFWNAVDPGDDNAWTEVTGSFWNDSLFWNDNSVWGVAWSSTTPAPRNTWKNIAA
jgi:hypothetical protein